MLLIPKILLSSAIVTGIDGVVSIPIILSSTKKSNNANQAAGGGENKLNLPINQCAANNHSGLKAISFGDKNAKDVCGSVQSKNHAERVVAAKEEYSELFRSMGNNPKNYWSTATDGGNIQWEKNDCLR